MGNCYLSITMLKIMTFSINTFVHRRGFTVKSIALKIEFWLVRYEIPTRLVQCCI